MRQGDDLVRLPQQRQHRSGRQVIQRKRDAEEHGEQQRALNPERDAGVIVRPVSAEIASLFSIWFAPMVLWFLGTVFTAVGVGVAVYRRRMRSSA